MQKLLWRIAGEGGGGLDWSQMEGGERQKNINLLGDKSNYILMLHRFLDIPYPSNCSVPFPSDTT